MTDINTEIDNRYADALLRAAVRNGECLECQSAMSPNGYCKVANNESAHRFIHRVKKGPVIGKIVRHTCDNRKCINPEHLIAGSSKDNNDDCRNKGRAILNGRPRYLSDDDKTKIADMRDRKLTLEHIANEFGVSIGTIRNALNGYSYASPR